jgi:hypothetical protein
MSVPVILKRSGGPEREVEIFVGVVIALRRDNYEVTRGDKKSEVQ